MTSRCDKCGVETIDLTSFYIPLQVPGSTIIYDLIMGYERLNVCEKCAEKIRKMFSQYI